MDRRSFTDLRALIARLRAPDGCPWDRAQTHVSLRPYMLEEAYEVVAAIDAGDTEALADELGDVLLQVLLHSQIAVETGEFTLDDVIDNLARKLIRRHPHVFGDAPSDLPTIRRNWEEIKANEPGHKVHPLPPLLAARKLVEAGASVDVSYPDPETAAGGKILAAIKAAWEDGFDPELALRQAIAYLSKTQ